jgi:hypothetical protein
MNPDWFTSFRSVALIGGSGLAVWILDYLDSGLMEFWLMRQIGML